VSSNPPFARPLLVAFAIVATSLSLSRSASAQLEAWSFSGQTDAEFGNSLANAGDVDGDGIDDLLVGEPRYDNSGVTDVGRVSVYSGANHTLIRTHVGAAASDQFGSKVASAGDVDLDGFADYVVGAPWASVGGGTSNGTVVLYSGATGNVIWSISGGNGDELGWAVAGMDDVNGDLKPDLLVSSITLGTVTAYDDKAHVIYTVSGSAANDFGLAVATCGDLDGDGLRDFLIGEPLYSNLFPKRLGCGRVHACSGASGAELFSFIGASANDLIGISVSGIGDVDGDRIPDLLVGGNISLYSAGMVVVASGKNGAILRTHHGVNTSDLFGIAVAGMRDMNHDRVDDYVVGAPGFHGASGPLGAVMVYSGATGTQLWEIDGDSNGFHQNGGLGSAVATGDFNGDGIGDFVGGDPYYKSYIPRLGWLQVGRSTTWLGCPAWWQNYGSGWSGKNGVPQFVSLDDPQPGYLVTLKLDNSLGATTPGVLFIGLADANLPSGKDGTILVSPLVILPLSIPAGGALLTGTLPPDPSLYFLDIYLQAIEADSFASKGLSFTPGLELHCGYDLP
jgi:FG-GAP repeat protein